MTCREAIDFIYAYLADELDPTVRAAFEHHLTLCPSCETYLASYRTTVELARDAYREEEVEPATESALPADLLKAILAAIPTAGL